MITSYEFYFTTDLFRMPSRACHTHQVNLNKFKIN